MFYHNRKQSRTVSHAISSFMLMHATCRINSWEAEVIWGRGWKEDRVDTFFLTQLEVQHLVHTQQKSTEILLSVIILSFLISYYKILKRVDFIVLLLENLLF